MRVINKLFDCPHFRDGVCSRGLEVSTLSCIVRCKDDEGGWRTRFRSKMRDIQGRCAASRVETTGSAPVVETTIIGKAKSLVASAKSRGVGHTAKAVIAGSNSGKRVDEATFNLRVKSCFGGDGQPPCRSLVKQGERFYCGSCGCAKTAISSLSDENGETHYDGKTYTKLHFPRLTCPLKKDGFDS